jgi:hypothetical protein
MKLGEETLGKGYRKAYKSGMKTSKTLLTKAEITGYVLILKQL